MPETSQKLPHQTGKRVTKHEITVQPAWHRQKGESIQGYAAFCTYLMLPMEDRTHQKCADIIGKSKSMVDKWSQWWSWQIRVAAYEEHYLLLNLESIQAKRDDMFLRHEGLAQSGLSVIEAAMNDLVAQIEDGRLGADKLKPDTLQRFMDTVVKVHRMSVLGRAESAEAAAEQQERLAERYADELATMMRGIFDEINLTDEQRAQAQVAVTKYLVGQDS